MISSTKIEVNQIVLFQEARIPTKVDPTKVDIAAPQPLSFRRASEARQEESAVCQGRINCGCPILIVSPQQRYPVSSTASRHSIGPSVPPMLRYLPPMQFIPFRRMLERVERSREDSDTSLFLDLMYYGELITKFTTIAMVSAILNDKERHRYRHFHKLVRADGIGEWSEVLDATLTGPGSQFLQRQARLEQKELTQRCKPGTWQHESVRLLNICLKLIDPSREDLPSKVDCRRLFSDFAELRNKTRGHGAHSATQCARFIPPLKDALNLFTQNHYLFQRPWVYLHRNLSGKYRVTQLGAQAAQFEGLKFDRSINFPNGTYVHFDRPTPLELVFSDAEATDFFVPNGGFTGKRFEVISYISGQTRAEDASNYLAPATELPPSETEGIGTLEVQGNCFGNLPPVPPGYVSRPGLEAELTEKLIDERHPMITLAGRGGIGKTSLALSAIHALSNGDRFGAVLWFSARDIDLLQEGPKVVRPHVLSETDIADEFARLMAPADAMVDGFEPTKYLADALGKSTIGVPLLFAIDNFETVRSPADLFTWLDTYVRPPNKVLITTRFRDFKGDYPVDVVGMTDREAQELINSASASLGVQRLLTKDYVREIIRESDGHPYVIKILLGEVAKANRLVALKPIVASQEEILDALFERTFAGLSPAAKRILFLLSSWRSTIPELAIHAVLARPSSEPMHVEEAIEELRKSSLIDIAISPDRSRFLSVPLVAAEFGKRKLATNPSKSAVEADLELLHQFGPGQKSDLAHGIAPKVARLFRQANTAIRARPEKLEEYLPILEFVAQQYAPAWLDITSLYERSVLPDRLDRASGAVRRYLETGPDADSQRYAWQRLAQLCQDGEDWAGELHARVEQCQLPTTDFNTISETANRLNGLLVRQQFLDTEEKQVLAKKLARTMDARLSEADGTDHSRLAWLYLHLGDDDRAREITEAGLAKDPRNDYCQRLHAKLEGNC
jgi:hypothetical protein